MNISEEATYYSVGAASPRLPKKLNLNVLNFALGIRASEINENFDLVKYWIEAERLRVGGWGLVEGFDLTKNLSNFTIHVDAGVIINEYGEEIHVPETTLMAGPPVRHRVVEYHTVDEAGVVTLDWAMYSDKLKHTIKYQVPQYMEDIDPDDIKITIQRNGKQLTLNDVEIIDENLIVLPNHKGQDLKIEYYYANDRIDGIFLKNDGSEYQYEIGIISTSPSEEVVQDYFDRGYYLIGFAYWHIGQEVDVEFFTGDRTFRRVFVDKNNVLYLNGKPYREKTVIYFEEPVPPTENDLWYNTEEEILYIWRKDENEKYGWQIVNDLSRSVISVHQFTEGENPSDLRTFTFEGYPELAFIPGRHQMSIIIDQVVIMEDQYEELYPPGGEGYPSGYGFKLKHPLERESIVEVRVYHNVNSNRKKEDLFPHESFYGTSGSYTVTNASNVIYNAGCQYQPFQSQIEVYKNGLRMIEGRDYVGILLDGTVANIGHVDRACDRFKIITPLRVGDVIGYRVLRPVASYANLRSVLEEYDQKLEACLGIPDAMDRLSANVATMKLNYDMAIASHTNSIAALQSGKLSTNAKLTKANFDDSVRQGIVSGKITQTVLTSGNPIFIPGVKTTDFIVIGYAMPNASHATMLSEGFDYTLANGNGGLNIILEARWLADATAKLYITGLKLGV